MDARAPGPKAWTSLPRLDHPGVLLTSAGSPWAGFPVACVRSEPARSDSGIFFDSYWLAFVVKGSCATTLRTGSRTKNIYFSAGAFAGYPTGCHWDAIRHEGIVESVCVTMDWCSVAGEVSVAEESRPDTSSIHACARDVALSEIARAMVVEIKAGCPMGRIYAECLSIALSARLASLSEGTTQRIGRYFRFPPRRAAALVELIDASLDGDLSVHRLARETALSPSHFAGCFAETFEFSVHQFVLSRRIKKALELLECGSIPSSDIALQCGFSSQSHFSSVFKKITGRSPSRYMV